VEEKEEIVKFGVLTDMDVRAVPPESVGSQLTLQKNVSDIRPSKKPAASWYGPNGEDKYNKYL
jgi:hypothetical protein